MFVDLYELLQISPNANSETIERIFRHFAKRYHPDNPETGNVDRFNELVDAHNTLKDPAKRAEYDIHYRNHLELRRETAQQAGDPKTIDGDVAIQEKLLALLYVRRRRDVHKPGIGDTELETLTGCPAEHLEFHLWYLKAKGWIVKTENGTYAITVEGVDRASAEHGREAAGPHLLTRPGHGD
jgi:curved DNA-binding protein CbpA